MIQLQTQLSGAAQASVAPAAPPDVGGAGGFPATFAAVPSGLAAQVGPIQEARPADDPPETGLQPAAEAALPFFWHGAAAMMAQPDPDSAPAGVPGQPAPVPIREISPGRAHSSAGAAPLPPDASGGTAALPAVAGAGPAEQAGPGVVEETAIGHPPSATLPDPARSGRADPPPADPASKADPRRMESLLAMAWQAGVASPLPSGPDLPLPEKAQPSQPTTLPPAGAEDSPAPAPVAAERGAILLQTPAKPQPLADGAVAPPGRPQDMAPPPKPQGAPASIAPAKPAPAAPETPPAPGLAEATADPQPDPIADLRETTGPAPLPLARITATPAALASTSAAPPRPLAATLIGFAHDPAQGTLELSLAPEELGRLRMSLVQEGDMVRVMLMAERPETLDLMRRHAEQLSQEFRQAGFSGATLGFGQWGSGGGTGGSDQSQHQRPAETPPQRFEPASHPAPQHAKSAATAAGLDLRL